MDANGISSSCNNDDNISSSCNNNNDNISSSCNNDDISSSCNNDEDISSSCNDDDTLSSSCNDDPYPISHDEQIRDITVRFVKGSVLFNFFNQEIKNGVMANIIQEIENRNLSITNYNAIPLNGGSTFNVTIVAQKEPNFNLSQDGQQDFVNYFLNSI
ncbi:putative uncharacterized protein DDB_G0286751 [Chenopodium quinoa]|uniref:putative uncharacterized protein DDB_G0286751 n=1 Tax=Chenopodium quinoa TaxID=63459 RepID=UPI000B76C239|nr:putative uncharacterized protein DDB_G0286751 [Chenopodium quinoa]XP_021735638.1 putative uncharacterized protein DDB_G0286751 [Chenopodium quinoa]XP_021735639.1 putative uncharacterized protein DDB_G0286751 [Chenopodium quinoa]XP_021736612.1 putative uncharacterized protein DDB_G0286751 [Chenopodium quinoa]XP_021736614.1 putative uncharacterized protein DDB_G0286751 [Chenopodium quinoa]XP_021736615.1 putative uncharacterized protein DDB_G0286751 [Chenopodium quinoa]